MHQQRNTGIELLRFALAMGVVVYHFGRTGVSEGIIPGPALAPSADLLKFGVQGFFALSGFVIMASVSTRTPWQFAVARFTRLGPVLLVSSLLIVAVVPFTSLADAVSWRQFFASILVLPLVPLDGLDPVMWTLRFEVIFYAVVFLLALRLPIARYAALLGVVLVLGDLVAPSAFDTAVQWRRPVLLLAPYGSWFAIGLFLYAIRCGARCHLLVVGAVLVAALQARSSIGPSYPHALAVTAAIVAIVGTAIWGGALLPVSMGHAAAVLGAASFPLYLLHSRFGFSVTLLLLDAGAPAQLAKLLAVALVIALSLFIAVRIEPALAGTYRRVLSYQTLRPIEV